LSAVGRRFAVVAARWNEALVKRLVDAALDTLRRQGARDEDVALTWVPGSLELPVAASWAARSGRFDAVIALGVVIRHAGAERRPRGSRRVAGGGARGRHARQHGRAGGARGDGDGGVARRGAGRPVSGIRHRRPGAAPMKRIR